MMYTCFSTFTHLPGNLVLKNDEMAYQIQNKSYNFIRITYKQVDNAIEIQNAVKSVKWKIMYIYMILVLMFNIIF